MNNLNNETPPLRCSLTKDESSLKEWLEGRSSFHKSIREQKINKSDVTYTQRDDSEWKAAAEEWKNTIEAIKFLEKEEEAARKRLIELAGNQNISGCGIKVSKHTRKSNIDYSTIPELMGIDLEKYRKEDIEYWKIT